MVGLFGGYITKNRLCLVCELGLLVRDIERVVVLGKEVGNGGG